MCSGITLDEYLVELATQNLEPLQRAVEHVNAAQEPLEQAREELEEGGARQVAEKPWGTAAIAIKACASWREGRRLSSHRELWGYEETMVRELGEWVVDAWYAGQSMYVCFYEGLCGKERVEDALKRIERLVSKVRGRC